MEELCLLQKGTTKSYLFRKKAILFNQNTTFSICEMKMKEIQLEIFKSLGVFSKSPTSYPKRIKITPMIVDCKIRLEYSRKGFNRPRKLKG